MIAEERLLIASHIKPWVAADDDEKVDPDKSESKESSDKDSSDEKQSDDN